MPLPVITATQMRAWESATWSAGQNEDSVILQVGQKIAARARQLARENATLLILAGHGHNGDDARAAARFLAGRPITVMDLFHPETDQEALETALSARPGLIIDGLFGLGLNRPLSDAWQKIINLINASGIPILAIDVPSGLDADTGETFGAVIRADLTLTVGAPKTGLLAPSAWPFVGRLEVLEEVGLVPCPCPSEFLWTQPTDFEAFPPARASAGHKGDFGHALIVAGSMGFHGAAVLAARGAQRAQPGLITVFTQEEVYPVIAAQLQSTMLKLWTPELKFPATGSSILAGPGLAAPELPAELRIMFRHWWRDWEHPLVVDASGLDLLGNEAFAKRFIRVLTPHPGEAARLLNANSKKVQADRSKTLRELSRRFGNCWVVLKGQHTLIGRSEGEIFVNSSGNPYMAQGGSGDLLAGFIAGLLAQPALQTEVAKTLRYAVWQHGAAADRLQATSANWTVEDLATEIGKSRITI